MRPTARKNAEKKWPEKEGDVNYAYFRPVKIDAYVAGWDDGRKEPFELLERCKKMLRHAYKERLEYSSPETDMTTLDYHRGIVMIEDLLKQ